MDAFGHKANSNQNPGTVKAGCRAASQDPWSGSELRWEITQCDPPQGERWRLVEILSIKKHIQTLTYRNDG